MNTELKTDLVEQLKVGLLAQLKEFTDTTAQDLNTHVQYLSLMTVEAASLGRPDLLQALENQFELLIGIKKIQLSAQGRAAVRTTIGVVFKIITTLTTGVKLP